MGPPEGIPKDLDSAVRALADAGQIKDAISLLILRLSPELKEFGRKLLGNDVWADEAYSQTAERIWRGFPNFRWEGSLRSWAYVLARREAHRCRERHRRTVEQQTSLSRAEFAHATAYSSGQGLSTTKATVMDRLRASLSDEDRDLLVLRIEHGLGWKEVAEAFLEEEECTAERTEREAARLRQRFRSIKRSVMSALDDRSGGGSKPP